jgi:5-formyltetrahydrofolate cyclo-ligase
LHPDAELLRHELRRQAREARRALGANDRDVAASSVRDRPCALPAFSAARKIGAYAAVASELSLGRTFDEAMRRHQAIYLPHVEHTAPDMRFAHWNGQSRRLMVNRFGIPEPLVDVAELVPADSMDVILLPLLAFDEHGGRLGSGAGYYDRALAFRRERPAPPWLIGVGFACQEVERIPMAEWDVPLDLVVTEREVIVIGAARRNPVAAND